jgi:4-hydroxy-2-oxoheptanedioate aldolase
MEGHKNLDDILGIDDIENKVDIIYIGAYDLSQAAGHPGEVDHPEVRILLKSCIEKIKKSGVAVGGYVAKHKADMSFMCDMGMQFITLLPDATIIYHAIESLYRDFKDLKG